MLTVIRHRLEFVTPEYRHARRRSEYPFRWIDRYQQEARLLDHKRHAAEAFSRANKLDKAVWGKKDAKIGFVAAGKNWLDLVHALSLLNIDEAEAERVGLSTYKVGQVWPMDMERL